MLEASESAELVDGLLWCSSRSSSPTESRCVLWFLLPMLSLLCICSLSAQAPVAGRGGRSHLSTRMSMGDCESPAAGKYFDHWLGPCELSSE